MSRQLPVALLGLCIGIGLMGVLGAMLPLLADAEEGLGLQLLYTLRGPETPRADVVVVAIDSESASALNLPLSPDRWPRRLHSRLLDKLSARLAAVIAFDMIFHEAREEDDDRSFAAAMEKAGNVVLTQSIARQTIPLPDAAGSRTTTLNIEQMISAVPILADAAAGQAPFPLPTVPVQLNQFWCFRPGSGNVPTLPVVALHVFARDAVTALVRLLVDLDGKMARTLELPADDRYDTRTIIGLIRPLRTLFERDAALAPRLLDRLAHLPDGALAPETRQRIRSLIDLYRGADSRYLNLYGPPGAIATVSYHRLLSAPDADPGDDPILPTHAAFFVGQTVSNWIKTHDDFYTVFSGPSGQDISGVEIAATALANLLEDKAVHLLAPMTTSILLLGWGSLTALIGLHFSTAVSAAGLLMVNAAYLLVVYARFKTGGLWCPLVVPILLQTPAAFVTGLIWKYRRATAERENIRQAFGYYLPDTVVDRLSVDIKALSLGGQVSYGVCLLTDAQNYTTLSETLDPGSLTRLMNTYYDAVFRPITANGGRVVQVVGDSVMALWTADRPRNELNRAACRAALGIVAAVDRFNRQAGPRAMPTRIGIHAGEMLLGNIGAMNHFEYRPVGDIVNTAARLEGLNKFLGTRVLVSREVMGPDDTPSARWVGRFVLKGKSRPVDVLELLEPDRLSAETLAAIRHCFASGMTAFRDRRWDEAMGWFDDVLRIDGTDGPARFYHQHCRTFRDISPDAGWDGSVRLEQK